jgi:hypothetical protein
VGESHDCKVTLSTLYFGTDLCWVDSDAAHCNPGNTPPGALDLDDPPRQCWVAPSLRGHQNPPPDPRFFDPINCNLVDSPDPPTQDPPPDPCLLNPISCDTVDPPDPPTQNPLAPPTNVPEPATWVVMLTGLLFLFGYRIVRKRQAAGSSKI